jgi:hypothetical protein
LIWNRPRPTNAFFSTRYLNEVSRVLARNGASDGLLEPTDRPPEIAIEPPSMGGSIMRQCLG